MYGTQRVKEMVDEAEDGWEVLNDLTKSRRVINQSTPRRVKCTVKLERNSSQFIEEDGEDRTTQVR